MIYQKIKYNYFFYTQLKILTNNLAYKYILPFFRIIPLILIINIALNNPLNAATTTNCKDIDSPIHGENCLFSINNKILPLCNSYRGANVNPSNILAGSKIDPRVNCMNLSDLPLCNNKDFGSDDVGKKCVRICSEIPEPDKKNGKIRGVHYAVHDKDCVRLCSQTESQFTLSKDPNDGYCKAVPFCHQQEDPKSNDGSCLNLSCINLSKEELNNEKFATYDKRSFCDGAKNKCYEFLEEQLPYLYARRENNRMCLLHECPPSSIICGKGFNNIDEEAIITSKGSQFKSKYKEHILKKSEFYEICLPNISCLPYQLTQHRCSKSDSDYTPDSLCKIKDIATTSYSNKCNNENKCLKASRDCYTNVNYNPDECELSCNDSIPHEECQFYPQCDIESEDDDTKFCNGFEKMQLSTSTSTSNQQDEESSTEDKYDSWFYLPKPHEKSYKNNTVPPVTDYGSYINQYRLMKHDQKDSDPDQIHNICYEKQDLKDNNWGDTSQPFNLYWHAYWIKGKARVPGKCTTSSSKMHGFRGNGYTYLCGTGHLYGKASNQTAYFKGYVKPYFSDNLDEEEYYTEVCVRYNNSMIPLRSCGKRECGITYLFNSFAGNVCGSDVCKTLKIKRGAKEEKKCHLSKSNEDDLFYSWKHREEGYECAKDIDNDVRIRTVKYGNYICAFLDHKGQLAYTNKNRFSPFRTTGNFYKAIDNKLSQKFCMSGELNSSKDGCINTVPGNQSKGLADVWRNFLQVQFIEEDFYQKNINKLRKKSLCVPIELRTDPPRAPSIATRENAPRLFLPTISITKIFNQIGGSEIRQNQATDFFKPSIEVTMKSSNDQISKILSLDINQDIIDTTLKVDFMDRDYEELIKIKKVINYINKQPQLCLYKTKIEDSKSKDIKIKCINRKYPEIKKAKYDNPQIIEMPIIEANIQSGFNPGKIETYENFKMNFQLQSLHNNQRTNQVQLGLPKNILSLNSSCATIEGVKFCAKREECSQFELEYIQNEFTIHDKKLENEPIDKEYDIRQSFIANLQIKCDRKKGIIKDVNTQNIITSEYTRNHAYGWFNEVCIATGYENKLKLVISRKLDDGITGKCIIDDTISDPNLCFEGGNPMKGCYCKEYTMQDIDDNTKIIRKQTYREAGLCIDIPKINRCGPIRFTDRAYNEDDQYYTYSSLNKYRDSNTIDGYSNEIGVNSFHQKRTSGINTDGIINRADFPVSYGGMTQVSGSCNGFWKEQAVSPKADCELNIGSSSGDYYNFTDQCIRYSCPAINPGEPDEKDDYILDRYFTLGDNNSEEKGRRYGFAYWPSLEKNILSDFPESNNASSCITGFMAQNANYISTNKAIIDPNNPDNFDQLADLSNYSELAGYQTKNMDKKDQMKEKGNFATDEIFDEPSLSMPTLDCNQRGSYFLDSLQNKCSRVKCFIKDPPELLGLDIQDIENSFRIWVQNGGALFTPARINSNINDEDPNQNDETNVQIKNVAEISDQGHENNVFIDENNNHYALASRSSSRIQDLSIITGECSNDKGFFQIGSVAPYRTCDHLGNLSEVKNKCATRCNQVVENPLDIRQLKTDESHGHALWDETDAVDDPELVISSRCKSGHIKYPYPPMRNDMGEYYKFRYSPSTTINNLIENTDVTNEIMPFNVKDDTRTINNTPIRNCKPIKIAGTNNQATIWTRPDSDCINSCPGFEQDPRQNVGLTLHPYSTNSNQQIFNSTVKELFGNNIIAIKWSKTNLGQWQHIQGSGPLDTSRQANLDNQSAQNYTPSSSLSYSISRRCGENGKWEDPIINCVAKGFDDKDKIDGTNAIYSAPSGSSGRLPAGQTISTGNCIANFYRSGATNFNSPNKDKSTIPITCTANQNGYIDKYYFNKGSGEYCVAKCRGPGKNYPTGAGSTTGQIDYSNNFYTENEVIDLACHNNYGNKHGTSTSSIAKDVYYRCGKPEKIPKGNLFSFFPKELVDYNIDRSTRVPYIICQNNGLWSGVKEDCTKCRDCTIGSELSKKHPGGFTFYAYHYFNANNLHSDCAKVNSERRYPSDRSYSLNLGDGNSATVSSGSSGGPVCRYITIKDRPSLGKQDYNSMSFWYSCVDGDLRHDFINDKVGQNDACDGDNWDWSEEHEQCHSGAEWLPN